MGASSGATHHLGAMQKPQAKSKSTATSKAFKPRRDAPLTALPCRLGASESLAARAALPSVFSQAPRRAPRLGTPFGGLRGLCPLVPHGVRDWRWTRHLKHPRFLSEASPFARALARLRRGCPSAVKRALGERGFAPHGTTDALGRLIPLGRDIVCGSPQSPLSGKRGATGWTPFAQRAGPQRHAPRWARKGGGAQHFSFF